MDEEGQQQQLQDKHNRPVGMYGEISILEINHSTYNMHTTIQDDKKIVI
jgi:hypothetical protein